MHKLVLSVLVTASLALAWQSVTDTPHGQRPGLVMTYAHPPSYEYGDIYALFPDPAADESYFYRYDIRDLDWHLIDTADIALENSAMTFQPVEDGVLWVVLTEDDDPLLLWYDFAEGEWDDESIDTFAVGPRPALAFCPNHDYAPLYPVPGWLYCLPGDGQQDLGGIGYRPSKRTKLSTASIRRTAPSLRTTHRTSSGPSPSHKA